MIGGRSKLLSCKLGKHILAEGYSLDSIDKDNSTEFSSLAFRSGKMLSFRDISMMAFIFVLWSCYVPSTTLKNAFQNMIIKIQGYQVVVLSKHI